MDNKKIVIIVLNYMNYKDTEECVNSILGQNYDNYHILIIDNASGNESYLHLKRLYKGNPKVSVIRAGKNYGFAKGNNIGIHYARSKLKTDYIMLLNSDTILNNPSYLKAMVAGDVPGTGVIGSKILRDNDQNMRKIYRYVTFPGTLFYYLKFFCDSKGFYELARILDYKLSEYEGDYILHGSVLLLTPAYFRIYDGLDSRTFLYCEEELLYLRCVKAGLKEKLIDEISLFHKGGKSSEILYKNKNSVYNKFLLSSYKFVLWESIKNCICWHQVKEESR